MPKPPLEDTSENASLSFCQVVIAAIRGEHRDYTTETLNRAVVLLAIPMVLEMVMESIFASSGSWDHRIDNDSYLRCRHRLIDGRHGDRSASGR